MKEKQNRREFLLGTGLLLGAAGSITLAKAYSETTRPLTPLTTPTLETSTIPSFPKELSDDPTSYSLLVSENIHIPEYDLTTIRNLYKQFSFFSPFTQFEVVEGDDVRLTYEKIIIGNQLFENDLKTQVELTSTILASIPKKILIEGVDGLKIEEIGKYVQFHTEYIKNTPSWITEKDEYQNALNIFNCFPPQTPEAEAFQQRFLTDPNYFFGSVLTRVAIAPTGIIDDVKKLPVRELHHLSQNNVEYEDSSARKMAKNALRNSYNLLYILGRNKHQGEGKVKHEISQALPGFPRIIYDLDLVV